MFEALKSTDSIVTPVPRFWAPVILVTPLLPPVLLLSVGIFLIMLLSFIAKIKLPCVLNLPAGFPESKFVAINEDPSSLTL